VHHDHLAAMAEATALTRAGRPAEATAVIQRALSGRRPEPGEPGPGAAPRADERADDHPSRRREPEGRRWTGNGLRKLRGLLRERLGSAPGTAIRTAARCSARPAVSDAASSATAPGSASTRSPRAR